MVATPRIATTVSRWAILWLSLTVFGGCVQFGWDRLSTKVPDAVLDTITAEAIQSQERALEEAASAGSGSFALLDGLRHLSRGMAQSGLIAAGESGYLQPVPLQAIRIDTVDLELGTRDFIQGEDLALCSRAGVKRIRLEAPLVFVGHGIVAPERDRDDYLGLDLEGKVALVLAGPSDSSYAASWYADWRYQSAEAARHGASGVVFVHGDVETDPQATAVPSTDPLAAAVSKPGSWETTRARFARYQFAHAVIPDSMTSPLFEAWIPAEAGDELLRSVGIDPVEARNAARTRGFRGRELSITAKLDATASLAPTNSYNLIGQVPGRYSEEQSILICARLDGSPESYRACAAILELARAFRALTEKPARSVVFVIVGSDGASAKLLLGTESYLQRPTRELTQCTGALVLDGGLRILGGMDNTLAAPVDTLVAGGILHNELGMLLAAAAREDELELRNEEDLSRWFLSTAPAIARQGLPAATVGCDTGDLRVALRVGFHMSQTRGSPRWDQTSEFRFFPR